MKGLGADTESKGALEWTPSSPPAFDHWGSAFWRVHLSLYLATFKFCFCDYLRTGGYIS